MFKYVLTDLSELMAVSLWRALGILCSSGQRKVWVCPTPSHTKHPKSMLHLNGLFKEESKEVATIIFAFV
jgi:hypothetical protein